MRVVTLSAYEEAERDLAREGARRGFVVHAAISVTVWIVLVALNVLVASEFPWAAFPVLGMSVGLFAHWFFGVKRVESTTRAHQLEVERRAA